jgi:hypothetical protein
MGQKCFSEIASRPPIVSGGNMISSRMGGVTQSSLWTYFNLSRETCPRRASSAWSATTPSRINWSSRTPAPFAATCGACASPGAPGPPRKSSSFFGFDVLGGSSLCVWTGLCSASPCYWSKLPAKVIYRRHLVPLLPS